MEATTYIWLPNPVWISVQKKDKKQVGKLKEQLQFSIQKLKFPCPTTGQITVGGKNKQRYNQ